jgi:DNA gyrase subunit B
VSKKQEDYNDDSIKVLKGLAPVRQNPAMFVGDDGVKGLHHIFYEVLDNSIDEFMAGHCDEISVVIHKDNFIELEDNGRGYPDGMHPKEKRPTIEVILTTLHAGGKFDNTAYKVSGGLHGVGVSCTNALSDFFEIQVFRSNKTHSMEFNKGEITKELKSKNGKKDKTLKGNTGTKIKFKPDSDIFSTINFNKKTIRDRLLELSYLNAGLKITFLDKREKNNKKDMFLNKNGIKEYIKDINSKKKTLYSTPFYCSLQEEDILIDIAIQHIDQDTDIIYSFANNIRTIDGGTHVSGLRSALTRIVNQYAIENDKLGKNCDRLDGKDVRSGVCAIVSVYLPNPKFEGQTKGKLTNTEMKGIVSSVFGEQFKLWLNEHPSISNNIIKQAVVSYESRQAAKKAAKLVKKQADLEIMDLPGKLKNCRSKNPSEKEIFIVEGNSAGGNAEAARNSEYQAILPLRGKIINTQKANLERIIKNKEISSLIKAIGTGIQIEKDEKNGFNLDKLNFHKIIITTDADVDGAHIRVLLLNFFFKYMTPLIENGHIWIAKPPLFKASLKKKIKWNDQEGKEIFIKNDEELVKFNKSHKEKISKNGIQRFKGLGELNAEQLAETVMRKKTRSLNQVQMEDFDEADNLFEILFGKDSSIRYDYIQQHSDSSYELDV